MRIWNFAHKLFFITRHLHTYELLSIAIALLMAIAVIIHLIRQKKRKDDFEDDLRAIKEGGPVPADPEGADEGGEKV